MMRLRRSEGATCEMPSLEPPNESSRGDIGDPSLVPMIWKPRENAPQTAALIS